MVVCCRQYYYYSQYCCHYDAIIFMISSKTTTTKNIRKKSRNLHTRHLYASMAVCHTCTNKINNICVSLETNGKSMLCRNIIFYLHTVLQWPMPMSFRRNGVRGEQGKESAPKCIIYNILSRMPAYIA